jgi:hypothetical protein
MATFHLAIVEVFPIRDYLPGFLAPRKAFGKEYCSEATSFYSKNPLKAQSGSGVIGVHGRA